LSQLRIETRPPSCYHATILGPNAQIKAYSDKDFKGTELVLTPNKRANDLSKLNMGDEIESMKISCGE
jgi:hypothetical protein